MDSVHLAQNLVSSGF